MLVAANETVRKVNTLPPSPRYAFARAWTCFRHPRRVRYRGVTPAKTKGQKEKREREKEGEGGAGGRWRGMEGFMPVYMS